MNLICVVVAILCGAALMIELDTGNLSGLQVAGVGVVAAALAALSPGGWPWQR